MAFISSRAMLLRITSGSTQGEPIEVTGPKFSIGRAEDADLVLGDDEKVSRHHAYIEVEAGGRATIHDLGSSNGTFVNGARITEPKVVSEGDTIRVGGTEMTLGAGLAATVVAPRPSPPPPPAVEEKPVEEKPMGRSTIQRIVEQEVREELAVEEQRMRRTTRIAIVVAVVALAVAGAAIGALFASGTVGDSGSGPSIRSLERATVLISGLDRDGNTLYIGSGSIIRDDGYILTNAHVGKPTAPGLAVEYGPGVEPEATALQVSLFQNEATPAKPLYLARPVAWDGYADVAVLKIVKTLDGKPVSNLHLPAVPIGDSSKLRDGEDVIVIGYPGVGGGFEGAINVSRGTISGFQQERHIPGPRAWIKTDAAIAHGNSGGLAADSAGHLIGIPSRIQCGSSLFGSCNSLDDRQGKIRPVALALPVIRAAQAGHQVSQSYLVRGTGRERFDFLGWLASEPNSQCRGQRVPSSGSVSTLYAVFDTSGMTTGEDIDYIIGYRPDASTQASYRQTLDTWPKGFGASESCFWYRFSPGQGPGIYSFLVLAGPSLRQVSRESSIQLGG
jgi:S1-C subfamily serine protease